MFSSLGKGAGWTLSDAKRGGKDSRSPRGVGCPCLRLGHRAIQFDLVDVAHSPGRTDGSGAPRLQGQVRHGHFNPSPFRGIAPTRVDQELFVDK